MKKYKENVFEALRFPFEVLYNYAPIVSGFIREQTTTTANVLGFCLYSEADGYFDDLDDRENSCCCRDGSNIEKDHFGVFAGILFDTALAYVAIAKPDFVSPEFIEFSRNFWAFKGKANLASLALLTANIGIRRADAKATRLDNLEASLQE